MNTVDVLRQAKEILSDERNWIQTGALWEIRGEGGVSYCALGAIACVVAGKQTPMDTSANNHPAIRALQQAIDSGSIGQFNDATTTMHEDLIAAFDRAILSLTPETQAETLETVSA